METSMDEPGAMAVVTKTQLTEEMRAATRGGHGISTTLVNMKLVVALTNKTIYGQSLLLFYYVYTQIELSLESQKSNEKLRDFVKSVQPIVRGDAFVKDLNYYLETGWEEKYAPSPAVVSYVDRIRQVEKEDPLLLLAYAFQMYSVLLAGGRIIKKMVKRSFSIEDDTGLQVFEFDGDRTELRANFKDTINAIAVDEDTRKRIVDESVRVFKMNNDIVRGIHGLGRQLALWILKWVIVAQLLYWTYVLFIKGKPAM